MLSSGEAWPHLESRGQTERVRITHPIDERWDANSPARDIIDATPKVYESRICMSGSAGGVLR